MRSSTRIEILSTSRHTDGSYIGSYAGSWQYQTGVIAVTATKDRIYQPSDLAGNHRKTFIAEALDSQARLRSTDGESLIMMREARFEHVAAVRDHAVAYLTLDMALRRPRKQRRPGDYGPWAFLDAFEDEDIEEFQQEVNDAIVRAASGRDHSPVERLLHEWRMSAETLSDPVAREILDGRSSDEDWVEVEDAAEPHETPQNEG